MQPSSFHITVWLQKTKIKGDWWGVDGRGWELCQILFADDTVLVADSENKLQKLVEEFGRICERRKVNVNRSKVMHWMVGNCM